MKTLKAILFATYETIKDIAYLDVTQIIISCLMLFLFIALPGTAFVLVVYFAYCVYAEELSFFKSYTDEYIENTCYFANFCLLYSLIMSGFSVYYFIGDQISILPIYQNHMPYIFISLLSFFATLLIGWISIGIKNVVIIFKNNISLYYKNNK